MDGALVPPHLVPLEQSDPGSHPNPPSSNILAHAYPGPQPGSTRPLSETNNSHRLPQADLNSIFSQAFAALRAMPQVKRCGYYPEKSAATAARPAAKPAHPQIPPIRSQ
ncbi:hypothetical protein CGCF413_v012477 [Colletotrichum fructicola]|nr:hypothetical protein CFRS1_v002591 [Colletotrichum fructicola]KAF5488394.1 hypothetical protein CGCF413_v012477 [Colletotrichum fructicola]